MSLEMSFLFGVFALMLWEYTRIGKDVQEEITRYETRSRNNI
jgi:hypothetical protein